MTPAERAFWLRVQRRIAAYEPKVASALLRAFGILRDTLSARELERLVSSGDVDGAIKAALSDAILDQAFAPFRAEIRSVTEKGFAYFTRDLPRGGTVGGAPAVLFDYLSPKVIEAVRGIDTKVMTTLRADVREVVRAHIENGLRDGVNPRVIARDLRPIIGLAPNQAEAVRNFEASLRNGDFAKARGYKLRDKRFDGTLRKAEPLTAQQIDTMTEAYRRKFIAWNAETNARTATLDSFKASQRLAWDAGKANGLFEGLTLFKRWSGVLDDREREEHVAMEGETVPLDSPYSNGEMIPGESTFNCRCLSVVFAKVA